MFFHTDLLSSHTVSFCRHLNPTNAEDFAECERTSGTKCQHLPRTKPALQSPHIGQPAGTYTATFTLLSEVIWDFIKFPYFADTTEGEGIGGWKEAQRQGDFTHKLYYFLHSLLMDCSTLRRVASDTVSSFQPCYLFFSFLFFSCLSCMWSCLSISL
jgi:hypothetical protein